MGTLNDADPKTRANAAGALGNLARNGARLCQTLNDAGAPSALLDVVRVLPGIGGGESAAQDAAAELSPVRTALFSLGNLASHAQCAAVIGTLDVRPALDALAPLNDETLSKYSERLLQKLASHSPAEGGGKHTPLPPRRATNDGLVQG